MENGSDKSGKNALFFRLFMANQKAIYAFILSLVHNCNDADDIMQETATLMWEKFDEFESGTSFGRWGTAIARYKIMNYSQNRKNVWLDEGLLEEISNCAVQKITEMPDRMSALQTCLNKLNEQDRKLLYIRYEQNFKIVDIAGKIGRSAAGLYKTMARIHGNLYRCINHTLAVWRLP